jgi:hypothetical protein
MRRHKAVWVEAAARSKVLKTQELDVTATLQAMQAVRGSWHGMRALRTLFKTNGINLKLATDNEVKGRLQLFSVPMTHTLVKLEASGTEKKGPKAGAKNTSDALVATCSLLGIIARDSDAGASGSGTMRVVRSFPCDRSVLVWGGGVRGLR